MESFQIAFVNVLITIFYFIPGFVIRKMNRASEQHLPTLSAVLVYIGGPFLIISSFLSMDADASTTWNMIAFFFFTLVAQALFMLLLFLIFRRRAGDARFRVMTIGSVVGNVGFFGIPILRALFPDHPELACYSTMFTTSMNVLIFTVGVFCLTGDKRYMSIKSAICNPTMFGLAIAFPLYLFGFREVCPTALSNAIATVGSMTAPLCMFILGIRLASAPLKRIFSNPYVYFTAALKLLIFPLFCYALVYFLPLPEVFKAAVVILSGMPCAAVLQSLAEMHKSETEMPANCVMVSTLCCFLTIPLLTFLL